LADSSDRLYAEVAKSHAKRNCLVIGPAGSGKLSLVRGLAALTNPRARKFLFDWEVELEAQQKLLADLTNRARAGVLNQEVWIHREIHRMKDRELGEFLDSVRSLQEGDAHLVICHATMVPGPHGGSISQAVEQVFAVRIALGDGGFVQGAFDPILACALTSLRRKYGGGISSIEPEAIRFLEDVGLHSSVPAMLNALERAFVLETGPEMHISTLVEGHARFNHAPA